jgi:tRNA G18 (ribose-2'-O)-methylase SpoU|tara:strand:+ start:317 stop:1156 length:840 start_codon:yes stop_codon:yes gene_type:complete
VSGPLPITDLDDPRVEVFRDVRDRDLRGRQGIFMAESEMVVRRLLRTPERLHSLLLSPAKFERLADAMGNLPAEVGVYVADLEVMEQIAGFHIHRGVLAAGWRPSEQDVAFDRLLERVPGEEPCLILAAAGINNSDNMGGLFRTAAAFGVDHMLLAEGCCDPLYRKAIRVSMGHALSVPWAECVDLPEAAGMLRSERGFRIVAVESGEGGTPLDGCEFGERTIVIVGAEGQGLDRSVLDIADDIVEIPMAAGVPSLNVVVAAGIVMNRIRHHSGAQGRA